jgi:malonyl-CoA O-methyltransferase
VNRVVNRVDKALVRAAFSRGAAVYDQHTPVQAQVRRRALAMAAAAAPGAGRVLDVGCGTGQLLSELGPGAARLVGVDLSPRMCATAAAASGALVAAADAEALPLRSGAFDLVVSTSAFQWLERLGPALSECVRVLAPGGRLVLALFAERTLQELRLAWREAAAGRPDRTHRFASVGEVGRGLEGAGLTVLGLEEAELVEHHADARAVLRSLKAIGAQGAVPGGRGLAGRRVTLEALHRYQERHGGPAGVPVTWHVVYAAASR